MRYKPSIKFNHRMENISILFKLHYNPKEIKNNQVILYKKWDIKKFILENLIKTFR